MKKSLFLIVLMAFLAPLAMNAQEALPYSYGFENNDLDAAGWTAVNASIGSTANTGSYGFTFDYNITSDAYLMSPILSGGTNGIAVSFYAKARSGSYLDHFQIGYTTDESVTDPSRFTYGSLITAQGTSWAEYTAELPARAVRFAMKYDTDNYNDGWDLYLDDFSFEAMSSCATPTELAVNYTEGATTATVSWRSEARNFNININGTVEPTTDNPYTFNVEPATTYTIKVQADCGDEQSAWASTSFFSGCTGISVPYTYGFEDAAAFDCWTVEYSDDSYAGITTNLPRTGDQCFWFYYTTTPGQYLISPALSGFTNGLHVEFWYRGYDNGVETFQVGYSTTDNDPDNFTWGEVITATPNYTQFKANYPAETKYVAVKHLSDDQYYLFLDDFLFEESSSCLEPSSVHVADITTTGATISWTAGASETAWDIFVTDDATVEPDETTTPTVAGTEDNPYSLTDLTAGTTYYVYVRAICGEDEVSAWSSYATFNTECNAMELPYSYDFEDATLPVCWNTIIENTSYTGINLMAPSTSSTNQVLAFYMGTSQNPALVAVLPEVDAAYPLNGYQITFDACYANTSSSNMTAGKLGIGIMTDPTDFTTFELIEEVDITDGYSTFGTHNVWFNSYTGNGRYIAIRDIYTQTGYVLVDNIEVTELPSCLQVTELGVSNIGDTSADLSWTANNGETEWTIYYKAEGAEEYTEVANVTENPYTLEGLTASTNYEFYVVANCSETAQSTPSEVYSFTTAMCAVADQCELTFVVTDSYGDSWNGNAIQVKDSNTGEVLATIANEDLDGTTGTETQTITLAICDGSVIDFVWVSGSYSSETSYTVYDRNGDEIFSGSAGSGLVTGYTVDCSVPSCLKPTELAATTTASSAVLSWTANSEETEWTLYWKENGAEEYTEVTEVTENPYTLEGLTSSTAYEFYVVANCSADDASDASAVYEFATPCDVVTVAEGAAYTYDFENETPWSCWTNVAGTNNRTTGNNNTTGGTYKLQFQGSTTGNIVAMPAFTPDINGLILTFWTRPEKYTYANCGTFSVGYMTDLDDASSFVAVDTYSYDDWTSDTYVEKAATFTNAPAGAYIAFCQNAGSSYYYWFVDDVEVALLPTFSKTLPGYGENEGGYLLIASPVDGVDPTTIPGMIADNAKDYDLFAFDQTAVGAEWRNYKVEGNFTVLESGKGYLYANKEDVEFTVSGIPSSDGTVTLSRAENVDFAGWNLVGNPFGDIAYIEENDFAFYTMDADGKELMATTSGSIELMEGIFVYTEEDGEVITFTTTAPEGKSAQVALNLSNGRNIIDRAIVRFNEGRQLPKFQLNSNSTKVYIPLEKDYAVVNAAGMGEMPVNFKAEQNGTYTISFSTENVEFTYLHLIDNMTGNEVDMLANPSYSFEANTTDYASRFRLVFATGDNSSSDFAFVSNGTIIVNGEGTLQVIDITGRILSTEEINGVSNINVNAAAGVYMLQLTNGNEVKTQKIVVK